MWVGTGTELSEGGKDESEENVVDGLEKKVGVKEKAKYKAKEKCNLGKRGGDLFSNAVRQFSIDYPVKIHASHFLFCSPPTAIFIDSLFLHLGHDEQCSLFRYCTFFLPHLLFIIFARLNM